MVTEAADRLLHLALFAAAAVAVTVLVLALLERAGRSEGRPAIRAVHVAIPMAAAAAIGIAERLYHWLG